MLCQHAGHACQTQPPLFFGTLVVGVDHTLTVLHIMKLDNSILHAYKANLAFALRTFLNQHLHTEAGEAVGLNAVERGGIATLL